MDLALEVKKDGEEFELYDKNYLYIRLLKYVDGESYDFKTLDKLPT